MDTPPTTADHTLANLTWPELVTALSQRAVTVPGREAVQALAPLPDAAAAREALARVGEMDRLLQVRGALPLRGVHPVGELLGRAQRDGMLQLDELGRVLATQKAARACAAAMGEHGERGERDEAPLLRALAAGVVPLAGLTDTLERAIAPTGELNGATYPELDGLRRQLALRRETIHRHLDDLLRDPALAPYVQERLYSMRGNRYVIPIKADARRHLPGIVHDVSASGATLFIEPQQVVEETNALTMAEKALQRETERILRQLSAEVGRTAPALAGNLAWLGRADLLQAQALLAAAYAGTLPEVGGQGHIAIRGLAHPLMLLAGQPVVRNDVTLQPPQRCMIISGANTGGKTVLLTSVGLCALLVRHGMPIPGQAGSRMDFFSGVRADVGDQQSLTQSLSTFSAQVAFLAGLLAATGPGQLVLIDEILTGTEPREGAALAAAVVEALVARGATVFATTHYGDLKRLAADHPAVCNASVSFDPQRLEPTYRLVQGLPGASFAFPIARRHGLDDALVAAAERRLSGQPQAVDALLAQLHTQAQSQQQRAGELQAQAHRQEAQALTLAERERQVAAQERRVRQTERAEISRELRAAKRRIARVIRGLQSARTLPQVEQVRQQLQEVERDVLPEPAATPRPADALTPAVLVTLAPGSRVRVLSLDRVGELADVLDQGRHARVTLGNLMVLADPSDLSLVPHEAISAAEARRARPRSQRQALRRPRAAPEAAAVDVALAAPLQPAEIGPVLAHAENTVDVRGQTLEEALAQTDRFLDLCVMKHISPVVVIHGHGTGRLRAGLRSHFAASPYVAAFRPGEHGEGMDGVTVVALNL